MSGGLHALRTKIRFMKYWLMKSEPDECSIDDVLAAPGRKTPWSGVRNYQARNFMRDGMRVGDRAFFYHSSEGKEIVGIAEVIREAYPDPSDKTGKFVCVDIKADKPLKTPVTMASIKADKRLADMALWSRAGERAHALDVVFQAVEN